MRLLLDEDVPKQLLGPLRHLLADHRVDHVEDLGWKGKKDRFLLPDAQRRGYDALLTNDIGQLLSVDESRAIRDAGIHHIRYHQDTRRGIDGLALAIGAVMAAIRPIVRDLEQANGQLLIEIQGLTPGRRHRTIDPRVDPPAYWPTRTNRRRRGKARPR